MSLYIIDRQELESPDIESIHYLLAQVLIELEIESLAIEVELLNDLQIARLNEKFFSRPRPTNVISFPLEKDSGHLGDVVISLETVRRETKGLGYSLEEGIAYYLIHGILHLLGYEHVDVKPEEAVKMENRQDELFDLALEAKNN